MYAITTADMSAITFEMMKEVNKQRRALEDEFYHLSELQYYVTLLHAIYQANNIFVSYYIAQPFYESVICVLTN